MVRIREKRHRLQKELYRGTVTASFTLCIRDGIELFTANDVVQIFIGILTSATNSSGCVVPAYCYMPDHQHLVLTGMDDRADLWRAVTAYKQKAGYWLSQNRPPVKWQKDFFDHVIRTNENLGTQVRYVLDNPVRKGLVARWQDYPYSGSLGCSLEDMLISTI